jgi:hypothetical protein
MKKVDGRADQHVLACAAFELLNGAPPFQRDQTSVSYKRTCRTGHRSWHRGSG